MVEKFNTIQQLIQKYPKIDLGTAQDLTGYSVNNLIPLFRVQKEGSHRPTWACQCKVCDMYKVVTGPQIKRYNTPGCCGNVNNLKGQRFGRLVVEKMLDKRRNRNVFWLCKCDCGNQCQVCATELTTGDTQSCGCLLRENSSHGEQKIIQILKENNINFITQKQIITGNTYKYIDFEIEYNGMKYFIEYDGKQHFLENCHFGKKETESLQVRQRRDKEKNLYCKQNNIPLIRIPYTHYNEICLQDLLLQTSKWRVV